MSIIEIEAKLFCLFIIAEVYFFQKKNFQKQCGRNGFVYLFSALGILGSIAGEFVTNIYAQIVFQAFCWCCYEIAALFWCKYTFKMVKKIKSATKKSITAVVLAVFAVLTFFALKYRLNTATYILVFAIITTFVYEQYNKIRMDNLTKLYNRYGMDVELREQLRQYEREHEDSFYIIVCDLDNFKHINDTWGHLEGDRALVLIADVLSRVAERFRSNVFRIGGDEFVIITDISEQGLAVDITNSIKNELDNIDFRDDFDIRMSIGVALYDGVTPVDELLNNADKKMYEAKKMRVNRKASFGV